LKNTLRQTQERNHKEQHITLIPALLGGVKFGTVLLKNSTKESTKSSTSLSIPALLGGGWVGLLKNTLRSNQRKESQGSITQSLLFRWQWSTGLLKNTLKTN
jgi:hypothetical protein